MNKVRSCKMAEDGTVTSWEGFEEEAEFFGVYAEDGTHVADYLTRNEAWARVMADEYSAREADSDAQREEWRQMAAAYRMAAGNPIIAGHWVMVEREFHPDALVGPFATIEGAEHALEHSTVVDSLCEEDSTECYVVSAPAGPDAEVFDVSEGES